MSRALKRALMAVAMVSASASGQALAQNSIVIAVPNADKVEAIRATYECADGAQIQVEYFNAGPVSLAAVSTQGEFVVMSNVLSGSGAKYAGNRFVWWTKGNSADLYDLTKGEDAPPVSCTEKAK